MKAIALDCASEFLSVAILADNRVLAFRHERIGNRHSDELLATIDALLDEAKLLRKDIDRVYVGQGPGSFTGIRVALGVAKGLVLSLHANAFGQSSLHLIAAQSQSNGPVHVLVDARMQRCYSAQFNVIENHAHLVGDINEVEPSRIVIEDNVTLMGNGWSIYSDQIPFNADLSNNIESAVFPDVRQFLNIAEDELNIGQHALTPIYVRNDVATPKKT